MKAGPKARVDGSPLPFITDSLGAARFAEFCPEFVVTPKGTGAREPMLLRAWQVDLVRVCARHRAPPAAGGLDDAPGPGEVDAGGGAGPVRADARRRGRLGGRGRDRRAPGRDRVPDRRPDGRAAPRAGVPCRSTRTGCSCRSGAPRSRAPGRAEAAWRVWTPSLSILDEIGVISRDVYEVVALARASGRPRRCWASGRRDRTRTTQCWPTCAPTPPEPR